MYSTGIRILLTIAIVLLVHEERGIWTAISIGLIGISVEMLNIMVRKIANG